MTSEPRPLLLERVQGTLRARSLLAPRDRVAIAVSGGPDSLALLHALVELRDDWSLELVAAHLKHGMRPGAADEDAAFVAAEAARLGLPCVVGHDDVPGRARAARVSLEEAGREARYAFLEQVAADHRCNRVATGHTADDRVETLLMNLARGTGIDGLAGIPARRPLRPGRPTPEVVRPLIDCSRQEVLAYCAARGLAPRWDVTNEAPEPARNRVRRELLPWLERELAPAIRRRLLRLAELAEEEGALLRELGRDLLQRATLSSGAGVLRLNAAALAAAPPALARRALREALRDLRADLRGIDWETVEGLLRLARGELLTGVTLPDAALTAARQGGALVLSATAMPPAEAPSIERGLPLPGSVDVPEAGCRIETSLEGRPDVVQGDPAQEVLLDRDRLALPLVARFPRAGDRIRPLGMEGRRKLHDLFIDRKIPRAIRPRVLVVADTQRIVWVVGCCISEDVKVSAATTRVVRIRLRPLSSPSPPDRWEPQMNADERREWTGKNRA